MIVLSATLVVVVIVFVTLVVRHCKKDKEDEEMPNNETFVSLSRTSRAYEMPEITMSMKLEVQEELQKSEQDYKEQIYDYANLRLERSNEYVVSKLHSLCF